MTHQPSPPLKFLCFGVGAIGTYLGGSLALAGHNVVFLERPEVAYGLRERGLTLQLGESTHTIERPLVVENIGDAVAAGPYAAGILAIKSYDTEEFARSLEEYRNEMPPLISFQNGVENEAVLKTVLGDDKVFSGTITSAVSRQDAGVVKLERLRGIGIAGPEAQILPWVTAFNQAGLNAVAYTDAAAMKWSKMLTNLMANASSAILNLSPAEIYANPALYDLEVRQLREALAVMAAQHISVVKLPGTPVHLLAWALRHLPDWLSRPLVRRSVGRGRGAKMPSFHIDLYGGHGKSEVDALNGAVVRAGRRLGVPTPVNQFFNDTLLKLTQRRLPLNTYANQPLKYIADALSQAHGSPPQD